MYFNFPLKKHYLKSFKMKLRKFARNYAGSYRSATEGGRLRTPTTSSEKVKLGSSSEMLKHTRHPLRPPTLLGWTTTKPITIKFSNNFSY